MTGAGLPSGARSAMPVRTACELPSKPPELGARPYEAVFIARHSIARAPIERQREIILSCDEKAIQQAAVEMISRRAREKAAPTRCSPPGKRSCRPSAITDRHRSAVAHRRGHARIFGRIKSAWTIRTMSLDEIAAFKLPAADDCHLFCWTTQNFLFDAGQILDGWGFHYACPFVWLKPGGFQLLGLPQYNIEIVLYGRKGTPTFIEPKTSNRFEGARREHSRKPDEFYDMIRRVTAGPRIDIFSREPREGFDQYGNETDKFVTANDHQSSRPAAEW